MRRLIEKEVFENAVKQSISIGQATRLLGISNQYGTFKYWQKRYNTSIDHFTHEREKPKRLKRICPVCEKKFDIPDRKYARDQVTCSRACSNKHFRIGPGNGNWNDDTYRSTCFWYHEKKCVVCDEKLIVAVHHFDGDQTNNSPENLIPICPTHHQYWHSQHRHLIEKKVVEFREEFISGR